MERMAPGLKRLLDGLAVAPGLPRAPAAPPLPALDPRPGDAPARTPGDGPAARPPQVRDAGTGGARDGNPAAAGPAPDAVVRPAGRTRSPRSPDPGTPLRLSLELRQALRRRRAGPHPAGTLDVVRKLYETTTLSYRAMAARTGVSIATIARQARRGGWLRPETGFGEEHYTPEGRRRMRRQALAERLLTLAEWQVEAAALDPRASKTALERALRYVRVAKAMDESASAAKTR